MVLEDENQTAWAVRGKCSLALLLGTEPSAWGEGLHSTTELRKPEQFSFLWTVSGNRKGAVCWVCQELSHHLLIQTISRVTLWGAGTFLNYAGFELFNPKLQSLGLMAGAGTYLLSYCLGSLKHGGIVGG